MGAIAGNYPSYQLIDVLRTVHVESGFPKDCLEPARARRTKMKKNGTRLVPAGEILNEEYLKPLSLTATRSRRR